MYRKLIKEKKFPWGGRVLVAKFPAHGAVSLVGSIAGGSRAAGSEELSDVHAQMLLEGTSKRDKRAIQVALDEMGASLEFSASASRLVWSGRVLAHNLPRLLALIGEILLEPAFPESELAILKSRELADLAHEAQETREQASIALSRMLFKKGHPNFSETTNESRSTLKNITKRSLETLHARMLGRRSLVLSVAGDISAARVFALAQKHFSDLPDWTAALKKPPAPPPAKEGYKPVPVAHKANIDYYAGIATGLTSDHHDYIPLMLGVNVLGIPGFAGRMMRTIREREGLTYGVYAYLSGFERRVDGAITIWGTFAPELYQRGRSAIRREAELIAKRGVSEEDAEKFRNLIFNKTRVQLSDSMALARAAHGVAAEGRSLSYLDEFPRKVLKTTRTQINAALKKYLKPEKFAEAAAGPVKKR